MIVLDRRRNRLATQSRCSQARRVLQKQEVKDKKPGQDADTQAHRKPPIADDR